jgi:hypothetical protein
VTVFPFPTFLSANVAVPPLRLTSSEPTTPDNERPVIVALLFPSYTLLAAVKVPLTALGPTVRAPVPLLVEKLASPAKLAPTAVAYVPALMLPRLTFVRLATPLAFVVALPTPVPFRLNVTVLPSAPEPPEVSVAERLTVLP